MYTVASGQMSCLALVDQEHVIRETEICEYINAGHTTSLLVYLNTLYIYNF